jgi:phosphoribosylamine--glycine ligase
MAKVLVVGSGGREHALAWKILQSTKVDQIFVAPGNGGTELEDGITNINIAVTEKEKLVDFATQNDIDLCVIGPDDVLANGLADDMYKASITTFGPIQAAARIESSKAFSKNLMQNAKIPTAKFETFKDSESAITYVKQNKLPIVIKASGLALGKGVYICDTLDEAIKAVNEIMEEKIFGNSGNEVVIEEFITGSEISTHALCDKTTSLLFPPSQDHKQIFDGDKGPNTGGMGVIASKELLPDSEMKQIQKIVIDPALDGLDKVDSPFSGVLYPGLMFKDSIFEAQNAYVIEFNARFGDPEIQTYVTLLESDLYDLLSACATNNLDSQSLNFSEKASVCVVLASGGYPSAYEKGKLITGIEDANQLDGVKVFHAGTKIKPDSDNEVLTNGGRVLNVVATGDTIKNAIDKAYEAVKLIDFEGKTHRTDIGKKWLK